MKIRKASKKDLGVVLELLLEMYAEERDTLDPLLKKPSSVAGYYEKLIRERLSDEDAVVFIAEGKRKPVGFAMAYLTPDDLHTYSNKVYVRNIYVRKPFRNSGVGVRLLSKIASWAKENKVKWIEADAYVQNRSGLDFWKKSGFKPLFTLLTKKLR